MIEAWERLSSRIEFAPHLNLKVDAEAKLDQPQLVRTWHVLLRQLEAREKTGFDLTRLVVNGVSFVGKNNDRLLTLQARAFYRRPDGFDDSYHVNFMDDAGVALVVFKINAAEICGTKPNNFVLLIQQPRFGSNSVGPWDIPGGMLDGHGDISIGTWKNPSMGILREFAQETRFKSGKASPFPRIVKRDLRSLGAPVSLHPAVSDLQYQRYAEKVVSRKQIREMRRAIIGEDTGEDDERIRVRIEPFDDAYRRILRKGESSFTALAMARYIDLKCRVTLG